MGKITKEVKKIYFFDPNYGVASFENLSEFDQKITEHIVKNYKDYDKLEMLDVKL
ncbi:YopT-type cysteine protease domain-containing protein [Chryseobacterium sp. MOF25P]|uniref:YopT-type cysteine protease domain-containing protein n=1 Tax=Chryseobacterium sp. MOF25P TaxID=1664318 RepID=UPI00160A1AA2|nr:YopT-type cysteine protease domain-containing protein [Chryseobacterium sp. MOF25P]